MLKILIIISLILSTINKNIGLNVDINNEVKTKILLYQTSWDGNYNLYIEGEKLSTGEMSGRDYSFIIKMGKVVLKANSFHEPIFCEGEYKALEKNNQLEIIYAGNNPDFCKQNEANFIIKKEGNKFFIKGSDFNTDKWLLLKKTPQKS